MANDAPAKRPRRSRPAHSSRLARLLRQQASLRAVIESISGELELRPLLTRIVRSACELLEADHGTIGLVDDVANVVRTAAGYNMPPNELGAEMAPGVGLAGQVYLRRVPIVLRRYGDVPRPTQAGMVENTVIGMPIVWRGRMIGFFGIGRAGRAGRPATGKRRGTRGTRPQPFSRADVNVLEAFARHAAIAIQNARQYEEELGRAERLAVVARVGRIVTANLELSEILQRAADAVHELLGYPNIAIPIVEPDDPKTLVLSTVGGHYRDLVRGEYRIPIERGIMGAAARAGETILVNDVANDPRYLATPGSKGIYAELAVPILLGGRVLGVLNVESDRPMTADDASNVRVVADQLAVAIENARLYATAHQLAAIQERNRIARDLHDSVTQLLFSITLIGESLGEAWRRDPAEGERRAGRLLELSRLALGEMRELLEELRSASPKNGSATAALARANGPAPTTGQGGRGHGLVAALRTYVRGVAGDGLTIRLHVAEYAPQPRPCEDALYRIAQEALSNVVKHAKATRAELTLATAADGTRMTVVDDGAGFSLDRPARRSDAAVRSGKSGGFGLVTIHERAAALGGSVRVHTKPGSGTTVQVYVPRQEEGSA